MLALLGSTRPRPAHTAHVDIYCRALRHSLSSHHLKVPLLMCVMTANGKLALRSSRRDSCDVHTENTAPRICHARQTASGCVYVFVGLVDDS